LVQWCPRNKLYHILGANLRFLQCFFYAHLLTNAKLPKSQITVAIQEMEIHLNEDLDNKAMQDLLVDARVGSSTVSLLSLGSGAPKVFGSGTLVKCSGVQGILTCAHVYDAVFDQQADVGVCVYPVSRDVFQRKALKKEHLDGVRIPTSGKDRDEYGPDLAFIRVPDVDMAAFSYVVTVIDLDLGRKKASAKSKGQAKCFDVVAGAIEALTDEPVIADGKGVYIPEGRINAGNTIGIDEIAGYDIVTFEPKLEKAADEPASYGATSGGGFWRLCLGEGEEAPTARLLGVAFYETEAPGRKLKCHGPKSVFETLLPLIHEKWPSK